LEAVRVGTASRQIGERNHNLPVKENRVRALWTVLRGGTVM